MVLDEQQKRRFSRSPAAPAKITAETALPHDIKPMLATLTKRPFDDPDWIFEIKWDGYRALARIENGAVELRSRRGQNFNKNYRPVALELARIKHDLIFDGEIVVLNERGLPEFQLLQNWKRDRQGLLAYIVFDLIYLDGQALQSEQLMSRKKRLATILLPARHLRLGEHIEETGRSFFETAARFGLEGIIAKKKDSQYKPGERSLNWLKIKTERRQEAIIGGYTERRERADELGALVLGVMKNGKLKYIGHTGAAMPEADQKELLARMRQLEQKACPFEPIPPTNTIAHWLSPQLVCEVKFREWTTDGHMRQPVFLGLRLDKNPGDVHRE